MKTNYLSIQARRHEPFVFPNCSVIYSAEVGVLLRDLLLWRHGPFFRLFSDSFITNLLNNAVLGMLKSTFLHSVINYKLSVIHIIFAPV